MNPVFDFLLRGIGSQVRIGKGGPQIKGSSSGLDIRLPDDSDFGRLRVGNPQSGNDAVNLDWIKEQVLSNWNVPVQSLSDLRAIPAFDRKDKQIREVENELAFYQFDSESTATVPDPQDVTRCVVPNDIALPNPGRWLKTTARVQQHSQLLGLASSDDHPQYQLRTEKNSVNGFPGLSNDSGNPGIELISNGSIVSVIRSLATAAKSFFLPDKNGTLALDDPFIGATDTTNGIKGLVPFPLILDREKFLSGDGTWKTNFGSLKNSPLQNSAYTASKYERILCDVSGGGISITLPLNPEDNTVVGILDVSNVAGTNPITVLRNGQLIEDQTEDWQLDLDGGYWELAFSSQRESWYFLSLPAYNNVSPSAGFISDNPLFTETSLAPSARAVKQYADTQDLTVLQNVALVGTFQEGSGNAVVGTLIKNAWFEGITNSTGLCSVATGLGNNILTVIAFISDGSGKWFSASTSAGSNTIYYDDSGNISIQFSGNVLFQTRSVRFKVEYK
ncbi:hypothetical protein [Leptospira adleri]|uniref:Uncharacterized protein n=1 Tax=Leptospira adleri TaxID=2023186 RepID=A0A2M9YJ59_9LEPT|nr:hypothetical protein [Leptospira adleri]PJZ51536.1 hypothetical protein CH380_19830 [Leptospira adleri]PJZ60259.1 hypothetical protein CH376_19350 [Leptospira adleri]